MMKMVRLQLDMTHPLLNYKILLGNIIASPMDPEKGALLAEQRQMRDLRQRLALATEVLYLTPGERSDLVMKCERTPWKWNDDVIVEFADALMHAPEVELSESSSGLPIS